MIKSHFILFISLLLSNLAWAQNTNTQQNNTANSQDINAMMEMLQNEDLGKAIQDLSKQMEGLNLDGQNTGLSQLLQQMGLSPNESADFEQLAAQLQKEAQAGGGFPAIAQALSTNGQLQRQGEFFNSMSNQDFNIFKGLTAMKYAYDIDPNSNKASRRAATDNYLNLAGSGATQEQKDLFFKMMEAHQGKTTPVFTDITLDVDGQQQKLSELMIQTAQETQSDTENAINEMNNKYKNMSYEEFKADIPPFLVEEMGETKVRRLYKEVQANGGDLLKAISTLEKEYK